VNLSIPAIVYCRPLEHSEQEWTELARGSGFIELPTGMEFGIRAKSINDSDLSQLVNDLMDCPSITYLNLSENRNISDEGITKLVHLKDLADLNLSSCTINNQSLVVLAKLPNLVRLDLSYCNRLTDAGVKYFKLLTRLTFLDLLGTLKISKRGLAKVQRRGLTIHK
jgi:hypothetical protein